MTFDEQIQISSNIRNLRLSHGLTQQQVADTLFVCRSRYSLIENGRIEIPLSILIKLSSIYDVTLDYIINSTVTVNCDTDRSFEM
jgi:Predicted transcriptional regulators